MLSLVIVIQNILKSFSINILPKDDIFSKNENVEDVSQTNVPQRFSNYFGQRIVKEKLQLYVSAAVERLEPLDHVLLYGPPGLGKTTLAKVIANELGVGCKTTSAPALERAGDLVAILSSLQPREILFIDEIHRLQKPIEEALYSAMESFFVDIILGQGAGAKTMQLPLSKFTLIGATTKTGTLSGPLHTRFGIIERLEFYEEDELVEIIFESGRQFDIKILPDAALEIAKRARGTPRIVKRLVRRVRDYAQVKKNLEIDLVIAKNALDFLNIDEAGFDSLDQKIIKLLVKEFRGGPVGLDTLAAASGEDRQTLEDFCEPYLIRKGILQKTPKGRKISDSKKITFDGSRIVITEREPDFMLDKQNKLFDTTK